MVPIVLLLLNGCEKDELDNVKADSFNGTIKAQVENGESYNSQISKVWALFDAKLNGNQLTGRMVNDSPFTDGGFNLNLPELPEQYLMNIQTFFAELVKESDKLEISNPEARLLDVDFFGISGSDNYVDYFVYANSGSKRSTCLFVYVDSDATVKGGNNVAIKLKKGWNRLYVSSDKITSNAPKDMKWYLRRDVQ